MIKRIVSVISFLLPFLADAQTAATTNTLGATGAAAIQSTTSPTYRLSVSGAIKQFGTGYNLASSPVFILENTTAGTGRTYGLNSYDNGLFSIFDMKAASAARFVIDPNGNIGIGTSTPLALLHVNGNIRANGLLLNNGSNGIAASCVATHIYNSCGTNGFITLGFTNTSKANTASSDPFTIKQLTNAIGIRNNNPVEALDVIGNVKTTGLIVPTGAGAGKVLTSDASGVASWQPTISLFTKTTTIQVPDVDPAVAPYSYIHMPSIPALKLGTTDAGNVSVNKPLISLGRHMGSGLMLYDNFSTTADCSGIGITPGTMQFYTGWSALFTWNLRGYQATTGTNEIMRLNNTGNLMVGSTTDNGNKLQVNGSIWSTAFTLPTGAGAGKVLTSDANGVATWQAVTGGTGSSSWTVNGTTISNANTGVVVIGGTTIPTATPADATMKLAVKGSIYAQKLKVTQTGWADYVFDSSYKLPLLKDVETFIQRHQHLPGIPSAAEIAKDGIDVGDNQSKLLQKIEELTLYAIDQQKTQQAQQKLIAAQTAMLLQMQNEIQKLKDRKTNHSGK